MSVIEHDYLDIMHNVLQFGNRKNNRTGEPTRSLFGYQIEHNMKEGFPALTTKKLAWKQVVSELLWFLRGESDIRSLWKDSNHIWDGDWYKAYSKSVSSPYSLEEMIKFGLEGEPFMDESVWDLGPIYGRQWRYIDVSGTRSTFDYIDQIANVVKNLKENPDSRRLLVDAWNVADLSEMTLPPCHYAFEFYTTELTLADRINTLEASIHKKLLAPIVVHHRQAGRTERIHKILDELGVPKREISLRWIQRSADIPLGLPFNIASYALLLEIIAKEVNMVPAQLIGSLGDCHVYENQEEGCREQLSRSTRPLPKLEFLDEFHYYMDNKSKTFSEKITLMRPDMFRLKDYDPHPTIKFPLSN